MLKIKSINMKTQLFFAAALFFSMNAMAQQRQTISRENQPHKLPVKMETQRAPRESQVNPQFLENNKERMVIINPSNGEVKEPRIQVIKQEEFDRNSLRGKEYILAHPELYVIENN